MKFKKASYILRKIFEQNSRNFNIELWDGLVLKFGENDPEFTLIFSNKKGFKRIFLHPNELVLGEAFINKDIDIRGDLLKAVKLVDDLGPKKISFLDSLDLFLKLISL